MTEVAHRGLLLLRGSVLWHCRTGERHQLDSNDYVLSFCPEGMGLLAKAGQEALSETNKR
eukprot:11979642-Heterocapsa_arctica.AAC.1